MNNINNNLLAIDYIKICDDIFGEKLYIDFLSKKYYDFKIDKIYKFIDEEENKSFVKVTLENPHTNQKTVKKFLSFGCKVLDTDKYNSHMSYEWVEHMYKKLYSYDKKLADRYKDDYLRYVKQCAKSINDYADTLSK